MTFGTALKYLKDGKKVARYAWSNIWVEYKDNNLIIKRLDNGIALFHPTTQDMFATDWLLYGLDEEKYKILTLSQAQIDRMDECANSVKTLDCCGCCCNVCLLNL